MTVRTLQLAAVAFLVATCTTRAPVAIDERPREVTEQLMRQLFRHDRDLFQDSEFKQRYFSTQLQSRIIRSLAEAKTYDPPTNEPWARHPVLQDRFNTTILNTWDVPTSYLVGSALVAGGKARVPVTYFWARGTQYEGDTRLTTVNLVLENDQWRIDDLITHKGAFVPGGSLSALLENRSKH